MVALNDDDAASSVQVAVRVRPMLASEAGSTQCIEVLQGADSDKPNIVRIGGESGPTFAFDEGFEGSSSQGHVYERRLSSLVLACMDGYNATCLAYGQTGSGKTYTMLGEPSNSTALHDDTTAGVIPRALRDLFGQLERQRNSCNKENKPQDDDDDDMSYEYEVRLQFLELYGEEIRDLLTPTSSEPLTIRDVGLDNEPEVMGATRHKVESAEEALLCLTRGMMRRVTGATAMNSSSSRSHAILSVLVEQTTTLQESACGDQTQQVQHVQVKRSKFNFVDLAGSERQKRTQAEGVRLREGIDINKGLLVLGNVISALGDPKKIGSFVPYRDSKLTRLLKGSLGGNHKTLMIACVSPSSNNLEESLNCLRYANRAKNIQNRAVVNVDSGSRLVTELRQQVQALATDLLRAKEGDVTKGSFTVEVLKSLASGTDSSGLMIPGNRATGNVCLSPSKQDGVDQDRSKEIESELDRTREELRQAKVQLLTTSETLHVSKAEKELYRLQLAAVSDDASKMDMDAVFLERTAAYEKEIASLKEAVRKASIPLELGVLEGGSPSPRTRRETFVAVASPEGNTEALYSLSDEPKTPPTTGDSGVRPLESPEFAQLHSRVLQSFSHADQLEAEEKAECAEIDTITSKYLAEGEGEVDDDRCSKVEEKPEEELIHHGIDKSLRQTQQMEAHLLEISRSIEAKEELIHQLQLSQEKYAAMREFYEQKLHQMEGQVQEKESEREQLIHELQKLEESNSCTKDLQKRLTEKERHIASLRKKQKELVSLTRVSSKNESEINRLRNEVINMKQKKVDLQKQITSERKNHASEIQRLKKESMQREREASKWKRVSDRKAVEAQKAHRVASARLEQVSQLRSKYKEAERKLRVRTVKRGVMEKAGLDPVMVGRRNSRPSTGTGKDRGLRRKPEKSVVNFDAVREFLDQRVAEVGRKEAIADKLANEWEDHLELVSQKEELVGSLQDGESVASNDAIGALDIQIQYKEERIRHLSRRLGKANKGRDTANGQSLDASFLDDTGFTSILPEKSSPLAAKVAARVLFGMVVRERRRVASLARTASSLDEKALEAEKAVHSKDAAFRSYMDEERRERETMAQSQQEQILSLMAMVQEHETVTSTSSSPSSLKTASDDISETAIVVESGTEQSVNAKVLLLANERLSAMQDQLRELQDERQALVSYKEKEAEARLILSSKEMECDSLRRELNSLRSSLRQIREAISRPNGEEANMDGIDQLTELPSERNEVDQAILGIVMEALHPSRSGNSGVRKKRARVVTSGSSPSPRSKPLSPRLKRHVELMHTSDSEEDVEVPDWAGDIMVDLALIAEGEVPPSLQGIGSMPDSASSAGQDRKPMRGSVFDRLTHPDNFTGVQKQKKVRQRRIKSEPASSTGTGQEERRAMTRLVAESLDKVVIPDEKPRSVEPSERKASNASDTSGESATAKVEDKRSVFDRLVSPSNYTGTHKEKMQRSGQKKSRDSGGDDELLDELLASDVEVNDDVLPDIKDNVHDQGRASKISDYTQQDVFERLQRTTTQSYAVKHSNPVARSTVEHASPVVVTTEESELPLPDATIITPTPESVTDHSEYFRQNVFERLQKTTTQAYAKKTNRGDNHK